MNTSGTGARSGTVCLLSFPKLMIRLMFISLLFFISQRNECFGQQQDVVKVMTYNLLNYPDNSNFQADTTTRNPYFRTVIEHALPDILVVQEVNSLDGINSFLNNVMNSNGNTYTAGTFINGPDSDNGLFYKASKFSFISNTVIKTELRDINEFKLKHLLSGDTIRIYSMHLKASTGFEAQRGREVDSLRKFTNNLPNGTSFIVAGDFNIYTSTEPAYIKLLQVVSGKEGHVVDPFSLSGSFNQSIYSAYHTQATRTRSFGGGSTGGLDDRFDMLLHSKIISQSGGIQYINGSCHALGNDGNHYNDSINKTPNNAVPQSVANGLHYASDHLPVMASYLFNYGTSSAKDIGITSLLSPASPSCANSSKTLSLRIKNFNGDLIDFSQNPVNIILNAVSPQSVVSNFTKLLAAGQLTPGDSMIVDFDSTYNMLESGSYIFQAYTQLSSDVNHSNDTLNNQTLTVYPYSIPEVIPQGPLQLCSGGQVTLNSSPALNYLWNNGASTSGITVNTAGNYYVITTDANNCSFTSNIVTVNLSSANSTDTLFREGMGSAPSTTSISVQESSDGFDNIQLTMSGSGDVRNTAASTSGAYPLASGLGNVFLTNVSGKNFIISGINTEYYTSLQLSFGIFKSTTSGTGSDLQVSYSTDGISYTPLTYTLLPSGSGTATWYFRTISTSLPASPTLSIQFKQIGTTTQYRIDDVILSGQLNPVISSSGPLTFCTGDSVILTASQGYDYLWSNGKTSQSIIVYNSGTYSVNVNCKTSSPVSVQTINCTPVTLNLNAFLEGLYRGSGTMIATADPLTNPTIADTIRVYLASASSPYGFMYNSTGELSTIGTGTFSFPPEVYGNSYYIVLKHRNSLETWSKLPVNFNSNYVNYSFTDAATKAYGNNMKVSTDGKWMIYSGDLNQDGFINQSDYTLEENYLLNFISGYHSGDLDGNHLVESADFSLSENNAVLNKQVAKP